VTVLARHNDAQRIVVPANSYIAFLYLGSDGSMRFRQTTHTSVTRTKQGGITIQHGDVVGVKSGPYPIEILPKLDGFGFSQYLVV